MEVNPKEKKLELETLRQFMTVFNNILAIPAMVLEPYVSAFIFPLDHFSDIRRKDLLHRQQPVLHIYPGLVY